MRFLPNGTYSLVDPQYDSNGNQTGTTTRIIPKFKRVVALSSDAQIIYDQQQLTTREMNSWAYSQAQKLNVKMASPFSLATATVRGSVPSAPTIITSTPSQGTRISNIGLSDYEAEKNRVMEAIDARLQFQINRDRSARIVKLETMGIFAGSVAYENELRTFDLQSNDARTQAYLAASQEHQRLVDIEAKKAVFANEAQDADLKQQLLLIEFANRENVKKFQVLMQLGEFVETIRAKSIQEIVLDRAQTTNELAAILRGTRVEVPQFQQFQVRPISETPVGQYVMATEAIKNQQWNQQVQTQMQMAQMNNQFMGSLISAGGGILSAGLLSGKI